ncbi:sensor histidine kinase [Paenibacillus lactis]|uniref:sensor histidine kinase n=1 Tax=Paenibacillus lactis TaxID=228574 RepID=UPI000EBD94BC|nr:histidine kinase [Paenibacillus lactis]
MNRLLRHENFWTAFAILAIYALMIGMIMVRRHKQRNSIKDDKKRLAEAESRFRMLDDLLHTLDVGIWSYDCGAGRIVNASLAFHEMSGYLAEHFENGISWRALIHPEDLPLLESCVLQLRQGEAVHTQYRIVHAAGDVRWVQVKMIPTMDQLKRMVRVDGIAIDVTSRYKMEEALHDITEGKKMEQALKESMERYRRLVESSPVAIAVCRQHKLVYVNPAGLRIVGAGGPEDFLGTDPWDWLYEPWEQSKQGRVIERIRKGNVVPEELSIRRMDGAKVDVIVTALPDDETDAVRIFFEDVTARKAAERALIDSERINRHILDIAPVAMVLHSNFECIYMNPAGMRLLGVSDLAQLEGRGYEQFVPPDQIDLVRREVKGVYEQGATATLVESQIIQIDGTVIDIEVVTAPIPYIGDNTALTIIRDITEEKRAERERNAAEKLIRESEERYFQLQMSLDRFSSDLFGMVKISELNTRIVEEIQKVLKTEKVSLVTLNCGSSEFCVSGGAGEFSKDALYAICDRHPEQLPLCKLHETSGGYFVKIGEINGDHSMIYISEKVALLQYEAIKIWLETISRYVSVLYDNFRVIEDLTAELEKLGSSRQPVWLLRLMLHLSENERKRLSQDLHDAALQEQIIWYRKLNQIVTDTELPPKLRGQLEEIEQGLLDVIYQIRITCNELRPPLLKEEGLERSLEALFEFTQLRTNYSISFDCSAFEDDLSDDRLIGLYRIVQELLANATKHSNATEVKLGLSTRSGQVILNYEDNGIGMELEDLEKQRDQFSSMGIHGMKERVRCMNGTIAFASAAGGGLAVYISVTAR